MLGVPIAQVNRSGVGGGVRDPDSATMGSVLDIRIRLAQPSDRDQLVRLFEALWPRSSAEEHARELTLILEGRAPVTLPLIILVAETRDRRLAGFLEVDLRSHADGCNPSRPVGYVEGWYVAENHRNQGIGRKTFGRGRRARGQGCIEMASDTWIDNEVSQRVHDALGYEVVEPVSSQADRCGEASLETADLDGDCQRVDRPLRPAGSLSVPGTPFQARRWLDLCCLDRYV